MTLSRHDQTLLAITVFVLLFGIIGMGLRTQLDRIRSHRVSIQNLKERIALQEALIEARPIWEERYAAVRDKMDVFPRSAQVQTHWMSIMDRAANAHDIRILQRAQREETVVAGVCELPIEVRSWEGTLDSLVSFIIELETRGVMLELRELRVSPIQNRQGYLKGSFLLSCAYMRGDNPTATAPVGPSPGAAAEASAEPPPDAETPADADALSGADDADADGEESEEDADADRPITEEALQLDPRTARLRPLLNEDAAPPRLPGEER